MGEVYKARDTRLDRIVAVKILPAALASDSQFRERFDREARTISALDHPHICALYDVGETTPAGVPGEPASPVRFLVMQFLEGETLADRLKTGPLPPDEAIEIGTQIAEALHRAHRAGVVHRDLKPANIFVVTEPERGDPAIKIGDFGAAKLELPNTSPAVSQNNLVFGTPYYMSPEHASGRPTDRRTDVFAIGVMLWQALTGERLWGDKNEQEIFEALAISGGAFLIAAKGHER